MSSPIQDILDAPIFLEEYFESLLGSVQNAPWVVYREEDYDQ